MDKKDALAIAGNVFKYGNLPLKGLRLIRGFKTSSKKTRKKRPSPVKQVENTAKKVKLRPGKTIFRLKSARLFPVLARLAVIIKDRL